MIKSKRNGLTWENLQPWEEMVDGAALLEELWGVFQRFVVLPKWGAEMLALWTVHTYAWQLRDVTTYVGVSSPEKRCGKTTLLGALMEVVHRPVAAANISPPALFRVIEEAAPTLLIDEADTFLQGNEEMRGILNAGYSKKTAYVVRVGHETAAVRPPQGGTPNEASAAGGTLNGQSGGDGAPNGDGDSRLQRFSCWCPKVMAAIGKLPETLADRCIVMTMQRKSASEQCEKLKNLNGEVLRQKCARFVKDHVEAIKASRPELPAGMNDRAADIWEPLLVLADLAGGEWPKLARDAAVSLSGGMTGSTLLGQLLIHIRHLYILKKTTRMFSRDLVKELNGYAERPWAEALRGRVIDEVWLGRQLGKYGVRTKVIWIDGKSARGYGKEDMDELFKRYVTRDDIRILDEGQEG